MDLNINLDFTTPGHDAEKVAELIQASVVAALDANGIEPPHVTVTPALPARVLITVKGGIAEVEAVDGQANISIADFDNHDAELEAIGVEEHAGDAAGFSKAFGKAEKRLGIEQENDPAPGLGAEEKDKPDDHPLYDHQRRTAGAQPDTLNPHHFADPETDTPT